MRIYYTTVTHTVTLGRQVLEYRGGGGGQLQDRVGLHALMAPSRSGYTKQTAVVAKSKKQQIQEDTYSEEEEDFVRCCTSADQPAP